MMRKVDPCMSNTDPSSAHEIAALKLRFKEHGEKFLSVMYQTVEMFNSFRLVEDGTLVNETKKFVYSAYLSYYTEEDKNSFGIDIEANPIAPGDLCLTFTNSYFGLVAIVHADGSIVQRASGYNEFVLRWWFPEEGESVP